jgi:S-DNA-T family DNA segregation ATPase FtsK/SpoIIIE
MAMFMPDTSDITSVIGRSNYTLPEIRGRALIKMKEAHIMQCYLPVTFEDDISYAKQIGEVVDSITNNNTAQKATGVRVVADTVTYADLTEYVDIAKPFAVIGFNTETTEPVYIDLSIKCQLIVGSPSTGKTNILKLLLSQASKCFVVDSKSEDLAEYEQQQNIVYLSTTDQVDNFYNQLLLEVETRQQQQKNSDMRMRDFIASQQQVLVLIDDADNFIELCKDKAIELEKLIPTAMELGITFISTTLPTKLKNYDNLTKILRSDQAALLLGNPSEQSLFSVQVARGYKPVPDMGFYFKRGELTQVKLPLV